MEDKKVYTLDEVAEMLKITKRTLYNYVKTGELKAVKIGKYWRVTRENIDNFLAKGTK